MNNGPILLTANVGITTDGPGDYGNCRRRWATYTDGLLVVPPEFFTIENAGFMNANVPGFDLRYGNLPANHVGGGPGAPIAILAGPPAPIGHDRYVPGEISIPMQGSAPSTEIQLSIAGTAAERIFLCAGIHARPSTIPWVGNAMENLDDWIQVFDGPIYWEPENVSIDGAWSVVAFDAISAYEARCTGADTPFTQMIAFSANAGASLEVSFCEHGGKYDDFWDGEMTVGNPLVTLYASSNRFEAIAEETQAIVPLPNNFSACDDETRRRIGFVIPDDGDYLLSYVNAPHSHPEGGMLGGRSTMRPALRIVVGDSIFVNSFE